MFVSEKNSKEDIRANALESKDLITLMNYISRDDVDLEEALDFIKQAKKRGLWENSSVLIKTKARAFSLNKKPEEKLEEASKIRLRFFWKIILKEDDVQFYLRELSVEEMLSTAERMDNMELLNMNEKVVQFMSHS